MVIFVKAMPPSLSELKVLPSFCFAFKIPDDVAAFNIYVDGRKLAKKGRKTAFFVSCKFWLSVSTRPTYTLYFNISELDAIFEDMNKKITIRLESIKRIKNGQRGS